MHGKGPRGPGGPVRAGFAPEANRLPPVPPSGISDTFQRDNCQASGIERHLTWGNRRFSGAGRRDGHPAERYLPAMHTVAVLALDQVIPFDLSTPIEVFTRTRLPDGRPGYQIRVCAERPEIDAGAFSLRAPWGLEGLQGADTIIVPGTAVPTAPLAPAVRDALRAAAAGRHAHRLHLLGHFPAGRHRAPGRPARHHPLDRGRPARRPPTRTSRSTRTSCTSTTARSSPRPAPPPAWTCACT